MLHLISRLTGARLDEIGAKFNRRAHTRVFSNAVSEEAQSDVEITMIIKEGIHLKVFSE
jgi:chromosomal replication initiation ATPase DnaA